VANKVKIEIYVLPEVFEKLEAERGLIPRSTYVEDLIKRSFESEESKGVL